MTSVVQSHAKEQEESLSHEIDQNLRTLALVHPLNDTAKSLIVKVIYTIHLTFFVQFLLFYRFSNDFFFGFLIIIHVFK